MLINDEEIAFNSSNVFAALALFNQLTVPLFIFPITIPIIISCLISTKRIERFLSQPELSKEFEGVRNMARVLCKSTESLDDNKTSEDEVNKNQISDKLFMEQVTVELDEKSPKEIKINDHDVKFAKDTNDLKADVDCDNEDANCEANSNCIQDDGVVLRSKNEKIRLRKQNQLSTSTRLERNRLRSTTAVDKQSLSDATKTIKAPSFKLPEETAVCIQDARFSWDPKASDDSNDLKIDQLSIPKGIQFNSLFATFCKII